MACSEAVDLPCTVHVDPQGPYRVFWAKVSAAMPAGSGSAGSAGGSGGPPPLGRRPCVAPAGLHVADLPARLPFPPSSPLLPHLGTRRLD